ncbi:glucose-6-phosphate 1-epimerase [Fistulina hepatica ATCC 64428]|uniref:Glucose-6-phosphate 1-epimerase n=1 Tax=Fistulina hepatica ATCC 64428 TaxID=1128425 RepID=A0A0D7ALL2_9AGAR|nr:glucose-6-phosphate 1-epimerase [Fistulina hepatica ATCC 64428]
MQVEQLQDRLVVKHPKGSSTEILLYGATVLSWKSGSPKDHTPVERLFVSSTASLDGSKPVRGGIPVVFPCFGSPSHPDHMKLGQHGFARNSVWKYDGYTETPDFVTVRLTLESTPAIHTLWPKSFHLTYVVELGEHTLSTDLHVKNTSAAPFDFQALFHNYIRAPAKEVTVSPLQNITYYDKNEPKEERRLKLQSKNAVDVLNPSDAVYENAGQHYTVAWRGNVLDITTHNLKDVTVWNAGEKAGAKIVDMEPGGWDRYICVEPGYVRGFYRLGVGETWVGHQTISVKTI